MYLSLFWGDVIRHSAEEHFFSLDMVRLAMFFQHIGSLYVC